MDDDDGWVWRGLGMYISKLAVNRNIYTYEYSTDSSCSYLSPLNSVHHVRNGKSRVRSKDNNNLARGQRFVKRNKDKRHMYPTGV